MNNLSTKIQEIMNVLKSVDSTMATVHIDAPMADMQVTASEMNLSLRSPFWNAINNATDTYFMTYTDGCCRVCVSSYEVFEREIQIKQKD